LNRSGTRMSPKDSRRGGFSLIELLVAVSIVGILAGLAIPNMRNVTYRARATAVFGDLNTMRQATLDYNADQNAWPPNEPSGTIPAGMVPYLPDGFSFQGDGYELDFENLTLAFGLPGNPNVTRMVGAAVTATEDALSNAIAEVLGGAIISSVGNTHTVVFDAS